MLREQHRTFLKYKHYVNRMGEAFPHIFTNLTNKIDEKPFHFRYLLFILMGTEVIRAKLISLIIIDDFINELCNYIEKRGKYNIVELREYKSMTYGQAIEEFSKRYSIELRDNIFYEELRILNKKRNDLAHHAVIEYLGDIEKADLEIKPYVLTQTMDKIQTKLTTIFNTRANEQAKITSEITSKSL
jgi:hypothetical protein